LDSAIGAPMATFGGQHLNPDLASMAATYLFSLAKNHAFCDGNKRIAVAAAIAFLGMNDQSLEMDPDELADLTLAVAAGNLGKEGLTEAIAAHMRAA
jgi:death-on-curing protein